MMRGTPRRAPARIARLAAAAPLFAAGLWLAAPGLAQEQTNSGQSTQESTSETPAAGIQEEIVVTARKKEENIQDVPVAVTVATGEELEERAAQDISELQSEVPNLSIYAGRNQSTTLTVFMRGIGQADPLWGVDPGVGLYFDDVYIARPQGALLDVYDLERIEVLRGPQGTLYGKNTIGGAIKYVSKPLTDDPSGKISFTGGSYSNLDVAASFGGAIVPGKFRAKLALASLQHDGWGTNTYLNVDTSDKKTRAARLAFEWLPSDAVNVQFSFDKTKDDAKPKGITRLKANPLCPLFLGVACPPEETIFNTESGLEPLNGTDSSGGAMTIRWNANPSWTVKSITAYRESDSQNNIDFDTTPAPITDVASTYYDRQTSQELQFLYDGGGAFDGVFGLYYFDGKAGGYVESNFINSYFVTTDGDTKTTSYAVFGEGNYQLNDRWTLNLGLRATQEKKQTRALNAYNLDDTYSFPILVTADFDKSKTFDSLAPKFGLQYGFSENVMGYFTASRGFKSGGFNVRAQASVLPRTAEPFDDEILDVGEFGLKSVLADGHLVLNTAAFYGKYKDIQVSTFTSYDSDGDGVNDSFLGDFLNAGNATMKGVEVEYDWTARNVDWFGFSGNVSYLDATPDDFLDLNGNDLEDTQVITNAPKFTGSLRFNFDFPAWGGLITASMGVSHRDESTLTNEGDGVLPIVQPAFELYDAWISWLSGDGTWRVGITGKNLTDEEYLTNGYNIPTFGLYQGSYGAPRTVLATVEYRF